MSSLIKFGLLSFVTGMSVNAICQTLSNKISLEGKEKLIYHIVLDEKTVLSRKVDEKVEMPVNYDFTTVLKNFQSLDEMVMTVEYDNTTVKAKEDLNDKELETRTLGDLGGLTGKMTIGTKGKLVNYERLSTVSSDQEIIATNLENVSRQLFIQIPEKEINLNENWKDEFSVENQIGTSIVTSTFTIELKFEKLVDTLGMTCAKISFQTVDFSTSVKDDLMAMLQTKVSNTGTGELSGYTYIDFATNTTAVVDQGLRYSTTLKIEKPGGSIEEIQSDYIGKTEIIPLN